MTMPRAIFRYIEHELYGYEQTKKAIEDMREDILEGNGFTAKGLVPGAGYINDPTARKAVRLVTSKALRKMADNVVAIDRAMARLNGDHRKLFVLKYLKTMPWLKVCHEMDISDRKFFRLRREIVLMVAAEMGLPMDEEK